MYVPMYALSYKIYLRPAHFLLTLHEGIICFLFLFLDTLGVAHSPCLLSLLSACICRALCRSQYLMYDVYTCISSLHVHFTDRTTAMLCGMQAILSSSPHAIAMLAQPIQQQRAMLCRSSMHTAHTIATPSCATDAQHQ